MKQQIFIILAMIFMHIFDDFYLQSAWLVNGKQKDWWKKVAPEEMYQYDYIVALLAHSFSWTFLMMLPITIYKNFNFGWDYFIIFFLNVICHAYIDNEKANKKKINLITDQFSHILQIISTAFLLF